MKKQYKIQLPKGMVVKNDAHVEITDDCIYFKAELVKEQKYEPKDGDFIHLKWKTIDIFHFPPSGRIEIEREAIAIFKEIKKCGDINGLFCYITYLNNDGLNGKPLFIHDNMNGHECSLGDVSMYDEIRPATEKEKKLLIDKLAEIGKRWNEDDKTIEDMRWRAKEGEEYYYFTINKDAMDGVWKKDDMRALEDDNRYELGNYFKTYEAAEKVAEQIREIFKNSKAE